MKMMKTPMGGMKPMKRGVKPHLRMQKISMAGKSAFPGGDGGGPAFGPSQPGGSPDGGAAFPAGPPTGGAPGDMGQ